RPSKSIRLMAVLSMKSAAPRVSASSVAAAPSLVWAESMMTWRLGRQPIHAMHGHIECYDIGVRGGDSLERLVTVRGFAHNLTFRLGREHPGQRLTDERRVIDHEDPNHEHSPVRR